MAPEAFIMHPKPSPLRGSPSSQGTTLSSIPLGENTTMPLHSQFIINTLEMPLNLTVSQQNVYYSSIVEENDGTYPRHQIIQSNCVQV